MDGILNVYKEQDFTSFDVVAKLRGIFHQKKIGHTGTLDPMAEGVLPVCLGSATNLVELLTDHDKVYESVMLLGVTYDTDDVTGNKLTENAVTATQEEVYAAVQSFVGGYDQIPPMYSAKKIDGKKLYELARAGKEVERRAVHVDIMDIEVLSIDIPRVSIRVHCGKGTYIRSLIPDIGKKLGCGATMEKLKRIRVGSFISDEAFTLSDIEKLVKDGKIEKYIATPDAVFEDCKAITVNDRLYRFLINGNKFTEEDFEELGSELISSLSDGEKVRVYAMDGSFKAVYEKNSKGNELKPYKMFLG